MTTGTQIRAKRNAAGIVGLVLCLRAGIARSRLSDIERGYVTPTDDEISRIDAALEDLVRAKAKVAATAAAEGWPVSL